MKLMEALDLKPPKIISLVGGGGKTSFIFTLAKEAAAKDFSVLVTTTTAMFNPDCFETSKPSRMRSQPFDQLFTGTVGELAALPPDPGAILVAGSGLGQNGKKLIGYSLDDLSPLLDTHKFDLVLIEADGARMRPVKAPADHEPVIPIQTDWVGGCIGLDCLGHPLDTPHVHRPELLAQISGQDQGSPITGHTLQKLAKAENGLFKSATSDTRKVIILNKADTRESINQGEKTGKAILRDKTADLCLVTCFSDTTTPVKIKLPG